MQEQLIIEDLEEMEEFRINASIVKDPMPEKSQDGLPEALKFIRRNGTRCVFACVTSTINAFGTIITPYVQLITIYIIIFTR